MNKRLTKVSKYLAFVLRHEPDSIGLTLDENGFADIQKLVDSANASGKSITIDQVHQVVADNERSLFILSEDGAKIKAN